MLFYWSIPLIAINKFHDPSKCLCTHIHLSKRIFSAFNGHMTVIFLIVMLSYRLMKPSWCSLLIRVFPIFDQGSNRSFHRRRIKHNRQHKLKSGPIRPKWQATVRGPRACSPRKFWNFRRPKMRIHAFWGESVTENEFMIIKLDVASSAVSPF